MMKINNIRNHLLRKYTTVNELKKSKTSYKNTLFLPETKFIPFPKNIVLRDELIQKPMVYLSQEGKFLAYYDWQRNNVKGKEFILHDGPPYANGKPHMGHAINKIFKDVALRSKLIQGLKVHFVPGWDCHGLPIELLTTKDKQSDLTPLKVRNMSRQVAISRMNIQKEAFKRWGILGNWDEPYCTLSPDYVANELQMFWKLYEKGLVYYGLKPVYWSPAARTALAESELEYETNHVSTAVFARFLCHTVSESEPVYFLIWTTTPWTLPFNKAVYFSKEFEYSLVTIASETGKYIMASNMIEENEKRFNKEIKIIRRISHDELRCMKYRHPWDKKFMSVFEDSEVKEIATGLLHCAPAHGHKDFSLGLRDGFSAECHVDENGCYTEDMGAEMHGLNVLEEGTAYVTEKLKEDILLKEAYVHKYPYDWRTNKPIIIRSSQQWFINIDKITGKAIECLSDVSLPVLNFPNILEQRSYWCLSRQRVWGTPIPAFIHKTTRKPLISKELTDHLCQVIKKHGPDSWWSMSIEELFPKRFTVEFGVKMEDIERGRDILDVWFDSGVSWSFVLGGKRADLCIEGVDQFRGWFQSSLLTSAAIRGEAPYKKLLVHGFAVDENGQKMSKSVGNVFDPDTVVEGPKALGADTLRWWVVSHGHITKAPVSEQLMKNADLEVQKFKRIFKFLLGAIQNCNKEEICKTTPMFHLDRYCLNECYHTYHSVMSKYNNQDFHGVTYQLINFTHNTVSSVYIHSVKDRLYCDNFYSRRRLSCVSTLLGILNTLCYCLAPILPHLVEEVFKYHPNYCGKPLFYSDNMWTPPSFWMDETSTEIIKLAIKIKLDLLSTTSHLKPCSCLIEADQNEYEVLKELQGGKEESFDSELTELLNVASVKVKKGNPKTTLTKTDKRECLRCRRYTASETELCKRCMDVVSNLVSLFGSVSVINFIYIISFEEQ